MATISPITPPSHVKQLKVGSLSRTDTSDTSLMALPKGAVITNVSVFSDTPSNAATSATISVGPKGSDTDYINAASVQQAPIASGEATLVAGTVTVALTSITAGSKIVLTRQVTGGTVGDLTVGTITAGTSFVINSSSSSDTSKVLWVVFDPVAAGNGPMPWNANLVKLANDTVIVGKYAETGTASTAGGPWTVMVEYFTTGPGEAV